ncbi:hypothetical protein BN85411460 [Alteracholeplasma palmae J233]|uniref:Glyoxalase/fosfomycin resistance/dioxygenase domain-containing protein n=1 Tax=Alteracholeplasma palmae (strain ATCC 49389 / J233) TaxID=1318466 RepID=U4KLJ5_ALTPJ|nr:hypothetical protein BN85411460 [Alteracholeplasma palmae J233]
MKLDMVGIVVSDMNRATDFYQKLGFISKSAFNLITWK